VSGEAGEAAEGGRLTAGRGFTVALLGPDGAGKTTIARRLESVLPAKYLYMGDNRDASTHLLPTTRLVHAFRRRRAGAPGNAPSRAAPGNVPSRAETTAPKPDLLVRLRAPLSLLNQLSEEWYRQLVAWWYVRHGWIVLFDRHFYADYHAFEIAPRATRSRTRSVHGFVLQHLYPKPNVLICLDAPPEVFFERKGEGTLETLARRRRDYLGLAADTPGAAVVDVTRPLDDVASEVERIVRAYARGRGADVSR
jgi:thymidylate kinase